MRGRLADEKTRDVMMNHADGRGGSVALTHGGAALAVIQIPIATRHCSRTSRQLELTPQPPDRPAFRRCSPQPSANGTEWKGLCSAESDASQFAAHNGVPGMRRVTVHGFR